MSDTKRTPISAALSMVERQFGQTRKSEDIEVIPTGSPSLDRALGIGGWPRGLISEIWGGDSSGKTTVALSAAAECQRLGGVVLYVDAENSLSGVAVKNLGVTWDASFIVPKPTSSDRIFAMIGELLDARVVDLIVLDSTSAMYRDLQEGEGDGANNVANIMSAGLARISPKLKQANAAMLMISQKRWQEMKSQVGEWREGPSGGSASRHYGSVRVRIERARELKRAKTDFSEGEASGALETIGTEHKLFVEKNKVGTPFQSAAYRFYGPKGLFRGWELGQLAFELGVLTRKDEAFYLGNRKIGDSAGETAFHLQANAELYGEVYAATMAVPHPEPQMAL